MTHQAPDTVHAEGGDETPWMETARQYARNADYYRGLVVQIGEMLGVAARTQDDGNVQEDILCAKVPELVAAALSTQERVRVDDAMAERFRTALPEHVRRPTKAQVRTALEAALAQKAPAHDR